jgi:hypothetical protein
MTYRTFVAFQQRHRPSISFLAVEPIPPVGHRSSLNGFGSEPCTTEIGGSPDAGSPVVSAQIDVGVGR